MISSKDKFYFEQAEPNKSCLLAMRSLVLGYDKDIAETVKYGMPCFTYKGKGFCYLWVDKKSNEPYFLMVEGKHLHHPALETGTRSRMKILRIDPAKDLPVSFIKPVMKQALDLCKKKGKP